MENKQIEDAIKSLLGKAEELINDPEKRNEFFKALSEKTNLIDDITQRAKDLPLLIDIVRDYTNGTYKIIPVKSIVFIVATLLYVINPFDLIPDFIPVLGISDDATAIILCIKAISDDIESYKKWKADNAIVIDVKPN